MMRGTISLCWFFLKQMPLTQIQDVFVAEGVWKCYPSIIMPRVAWVLTSPLSLSAPPDHPKIYTVNKIMCKMKDVIDPSVLCCKQTLATKPFSPQTFWKHHCLSSGITVSSAQRGSEKSLVEKEENQLQLLITSKLLDYRTLPST